MTAAGRTESPAVEVWTLSACPCSEYNLGNFDLPLNTFYYS